MFSYYPAASDVRVMSGLSRKAQNIDPESDEGDSRGCNKLINTDTWHYCCDAVMLVMIWGMFVMSSVVIMERRGN